MRLGRLAIFLERDTKYEVREIDHRIQISSPGVALIIDSQECLDALIDALNTVGMILDERVAAYEAAQHDAVKFVRACLEEEK